MEFNSEGVKFQADCLYLNISIITIDIRNNVLHTCNLHCNARIHVCLSASPDMFELMFTNSCIQRVLSSAAAMHVEMMIPS